MRQLTVPLCVVVVVVIATRSASADPERLGVITVEAAEELKCPSSGELEARVDDLLGTRGRAVERMLATKIGLTVTFGRDATGIRGDVELHGARRGRRTLHEETTDCGELSETVALALAILIDPSFVPPAERQPASEPAQSATQFAESSAPPPPQTALAQEDESARERTGFVALFAGGGAMSRLTRPLAPALGGGVELGWLDSLSVRLAAVWVPSAPIELGPGAVVVGAFAGSLDACARFFTFGKGTTLSPCAGLSVGWIDARARGYAFDGRALRVFFAVDAGLVADLPLSDAFGLWLDAKTLWPVRRQSFEVGSVGIMHPMKTPAISALVGPRILFR